jgi:hypothetical protein
LDILDQRHFQGKFVRHLPHDCRDFSQTSALGSSPSSFSRYELKSLTDWAHNKGLNDATGLNRAGQFIESLLAEARTRLVRTRFDQIDVDLERTYGRRLPGGRNRGTP